MTDLVYLEDLLTNEQAATLLGIKPTTLEIWRIKGKSPPFLKLGTAKQAPVRYQRSVVADWLKQRSFASTSAYGASQKSSLDESAARAAAFRGIDYLAGGARNG